MYNNNNINVTPKLIKGAIWGIAGIVLLIVALAFIRPWYNVWSQEMEGKAEFAKAEQNRKIKIEEAKERPRLSELKTEASHQPIFSISGCDSSLISAIRL